MKTLKAYLVLVASAAVLAVAAPASAATVALTPSAGWLTYDEYLTPASGPGPFFAETWSPTANATINVTDLYVLGDNYNIYDNGNLVATTNAASYTATGNGAFGAPYTTDPQTAWLTTGPYAFAHASFSAQAGDMITINEAMIPSGFSDATVAIEAVAAPGPVPGAGFAGLAALALAGLYTRARRA